MKKRIKNIKGLYQDIIKQDRDTEEICFICLENGQSQRLMQTFCCKQNIHHTCYMNLLAKYAFSCTICKHDINDYYNTYADDYNRYNSDVLSLLSFIQLNIMNIEKVYQKIQNDKIKKVFCEVNNIALNKICKKIHKYIDVNCKEYFNNMIQKNNIINIKAKPKKSLINAFIKCVPL